MQVITDVSVSPWPGERTVITIGAYDGVHRGHQAVIAEVRRRALERGARGRREAVAREGEVARDGEEGDAAVGLGVRGAGGGA